MAALLALLVVALPLSWSAAPARADDGPEVAITLTKVTPTTIPDKPDARVTIEGTVTNTSKKPMTLVQVAFWRSTDPILEPADLQSIIASPWDVPSGARMGLTGEEPEQNLFQISTPTAPVFQPGQTVSFVVSARVDQLGLGTGGGVRLLGVHVRAMPEGDINHTVGRSRVLLPMASASPTSAVSPVVVLSSRPSLVEQGVLADDHLAQELPGRLTALLEQAERPGSTLVVDPALYDEIATLARPHAVRGSNGKAEARPPLPLATIFLARLTIRVTTGPSYRLPYGNPDLLAAAHSGRVDFIGTLKAALPADHRLAALPLAVVPFRGQLDATLLRYVKGLQPDVVIASQPGLHTKQQIEGLTVVNADPSLFAGGPGPNPSRSTPQVVGRLTSELTLNHSDGAVVLITDPNPTVSAALDVLPPARPMDQITSGAAGSLVTIKDPPEVAAWLWTALDRGARAMRQWGDLTATDPSLTIAQLTARTLSANFNRNPAVMKAYLDQATAEVPPVARAKVSIVATQSFVVNAENARLPITVVNQLDTPIKVKIRFSSENPQRIDLPDTKLVTVNPGQSLPLEFTTVARGNGAVNVVAQLVTESGDPVGESASFTVTATSLGKIGWVIMIASGGVLIGATVLRVKQVARDRAKTARASQVKASPTAPDSAEVFDTDHDLHGRPHP